MIALPASAGFEEDAFVLEGRRYRGDEAPRVLYERWYVRGGGAGAPLTAVDRLLARALRHRLATLRSPAEGPEGWFHAVGRARSRPEPVLRVYFHLAREGAVAFVGALRALDAAAIPFRAKVAGDPSAFGRVDSAVLYLPRSRAPTEGLVAFHRIVAPWLREGTPPMAKRLARGVAWADDPGGGESFGQQRCRILAEGLRRRDVDGALREAGIDPGRPHLAPGLDDVAFPRLLDAPIPTWGAPS